MAVTAKPDTGHGATLTLATTAWTGKIIGMPTNLDKQRPRVQTTHLGTTTNHSYMPGDLDELGELEFDVRFEAARATSSTTAARRNVGAPIWPSTACSTA